MQKRPIAAVAVMPSKRLIRVPAFPGFFFRKSPAIHPVAIPMMIGKKIMTGIIYSGTEPPETARAMKELTVKKTAIPTISSRTAIGSNVSVTAPCVWNSCTIESAGAGAVARAMPPNANAR